MATPPRSARPGLSRAELAALVRRWVEDRAAWEHLVRVPDESDRWWVRLAAGPDADVWLLTWLPGQGTELHDHGDSAAAFAVVSGELTELRVDGVARLTLHERLAGTSTTLAPGEIHDVNGAGDGPAVSLHAYSPPLTRMRFYSPDLARGLKLLRTVDTVEPEERAS